MTLGQCGKGLILVLLLFCCNHGT